MVEAMEVEKAAPVRTTTNAQRSETMIFNISLGNWFRIIGKLLILYAFLACYFAMLFFIGIDVRKQDYFTLPSKYFGDFGRDYKFIGMYDSENNPIDQNMPTGCDEGKMMANWGIEFNGQATEVTLSLCSGTNNTMWNVFPWVSSTAGLDTQSVATLECYNTAKHRDYVAAKSGYPLRLPLGQYPVLCGNEIDYAFAAENAGYTAQQIGSLALPTNYS